MFVNLFNVFVSFGHELAHTFGLAHDRRVSRRSSRKYLFFSITNIVMIFVVVIVTLSLYRNSKKYFLITIIVI